MSTLTTAMVVGVLWLKEPFNLYQKLALLCAVAAIVLFSMGYSDNR